MVLLYGKRRKMASGKRKLCTDHCTHLQSWALLVWSTSHWLCLSAWTSVLLDLTQSMSERNFDTHLTAKPWECYQIQWTGTFIWFKPGKSVCISAWCKSALSCLYFPNVWLGVLTTSGPQDSSFACLISGHKSVNFMRLGGDKKIRNLSQHSSIKAGLLMDATLPQGQPIPRYMFLILGIIARSPLKVSRPIKSEYLKQCGTILYLFWYPFPPISTLVWSSLRSEMQIRCSEIPKSVIWMPVMKD